MGKTQKLQMMRGTSCEDCYLVIAKKDGHLLGIRPWPPQTAKALNQHDKTQLTIRVHSIADPKATKKDKAADLGMDTAWPKIEWDSMDNKRAAMSLQTLMRGTRTINPEGLLDRLRSGDVTKGLVKSLVSMAGGTKHTVVRPSVMEKWITENYIDPMCTQLEEVIEQKAIMDQKAEGLVETFSSHAAVMKQQYQETQGDGASIEDGGSNA